MSVRDIRLALRILRSNVLGVEAEGITRALAVLESIQPRLTIADELLRAARERAIARDRRGRTPI